jgi:acyl carrier protein
MKNKIEKTLLGKITPIFQSIFDQPTLQISEETNAANVRGWDSFAHINLIVALENEFDIKFSTRELGEMKCVGDLLRLLQLKGVSG